ncbi:MAG TPA: hypothetical protein VHE37_15435 [Nevskiaceae bacterium]|nr:hypothetical protein [Nevskiaceae bacterium]
MNIDRDTELRRLASALHRQPGELLYLKPLDGQGLLQLRTLLQNRLLDQFSHLFEKMAASGRIAPDALSALLCRKVFGPSITANMSYYVPADRALRLCKHFDVPFMTDIAREMIPERAAELLRGLPTSLMQGVMRELLLKRDFLTMGGFTDHLPEDKALALMRQIEKPADCIRISRYAQRKDRVARLTAQMDDAQLTRLIEAAFADQEFVHEIGLVTAEMGDGDQRRMARLTDRIDRVWRKRWRDAAEANGTLDRLQAYFSA